LRDALALLTHRPITTYPNMSLKIRYLKIQFEASIKPFELPAFRGAVIKCAGRENIHFHNHLGDGYLYGYPVIQYKMIGGSPSLICVDYGVDEVHHFFEKNRSKVTISDREVSLAVKSISMQQYQMQVWENTFDYRLKNWLAINQENHKKYNQLSNDIDRITFLEKVLVGNILSFAKGIKWFIDKEVKVRIDSIVSTRTVPYKEQRLLAFDINFKTNVFLPDHLGIGKGISLGFGTVTRERK
jgi:hypothetical protein